MTMKKLDLHTVFSDFNLDEARLSLRTNKKKASGVDNVNRQDFFSNWEYEKDALQKALFAREYEPSPLKRILIRKNSSSKEMRKISIPTISDQVVQCCIRIELEKIFVPKFHYCNFGFIRGRGTIRALKTCLKYINQGYVVAVDIDIRKFFDMIKHHVLLRILDPYVDEDILNLIRKFIKAPAITSKSISYNRRGVSQGGCASQFLANIVLNELDWFLEENGIHFVRYADDLVALCRDQEEAQKTFSLIVEYLGNTLKLSINKEKTKVIPVEELNYLGYTFVKKGSLYYLAVSQKKYEQLFDKINRTVTKRKKSVVEWWELQGAFNRGWLNYYKHAEIENLRKVVDEADQYHELQITEHLEGAKSEWIYELVNAKQYISMEQWLEELISRGGKSNGRRKRKT